MAMVIFPGDGKWHKSENRTKSEVIVFIHHFGGSAKTSRRHVEFVNRLGYDAITFTLGHHFSSLFDWPFIKTCAGAAYGREGLVGLWKKDIEKILEYFDQPVIFYSFSSPSFAVPEVITSHPGRVKGWICDGGPFFNFARSFNAFFKVFHRVKNPVLLTVLHLFSYMTWHGWELRKKIYQRLSQFPTAFPILSIRGEKDPLVEPTSIDKVFSPHTHLNFQTLSLEKGRHLDGLVAHREAYEQKVVDFLNQIA